jgi:hypothetical protein
MRIAATDCAFAVFAALLACHVKQVPGHKTDISDAAWLCQLLEAGLLNVSFVAPKLIRTLRKLARSARRRSPSARARPTACTTPRAHRDAGEGPRLTNH